MCLVYSRGERRGRGGEERGRGEGETRGGDQRGRPEGETRGGDQRGEGREGVKRDSSSMRTDYQNQ